MDIVVHQRNNDPFKEQFNKWTKTTWSSIFRGGKIKNKHRRTKRKVSKRKGSKRKIYKSRSLRIRRT